MNELQIRVLKHDQGRIEMEIRGEGHTLLNLLVSELNKNPHVTAAYRIEHPLLGIARLSVRTDGNITPLEAIRSAIGTLSEALEYLRRRFKEEVDRHRSTEATT